MRDVLTDIAKTIAVDIGLIGVDIEGAIIAGIGNAIIVGIVLAWIEINWAIIICIGNAITGARRRGASCLSVFCAET